MVKNHAFPSYGQSNWARINSYKWDIYVCMDILLDIWVLKSYRNNYMYVYVLIVPLPSGPCLISTIYEVVVTT